MSILDSITLNPQQLAAVKSINCPTLCVAGAGSGKTKVLTTRVAYLMSDCGVADDQILAITFTNLAAKEMRERLHKICRRSTQAWLITYHSLCLKILYSDIANLEDGVSDFRVIDEEDQEQIVKSIFVDWNLKVDFGKRHKPKKLLHWINDIQIETYDKNNLVWSTDFEVTEELEKEKKHGLSHSDLDYVRGIYQEYQKRKKQNKCLDFNDLIVVTYKLLTSCPEVCKRWANKFQYIMVDEFQDTDKLQFSILEKLVGPNTNVFAVGDPDQTIYEWRGAYANVFKDFEKSFSGTKVIMLEKNYRSSPQILECANELISHNILRYEKILLTDNKNNDKPTFFLGDSSVEESRWIGKKVKELIDSKKYQPKDIVILYRANFTSRIPEEGLIFNQIPYRVYGGIKFFQRKEIKDILAYLTLMTNPQDEISIRRVINVPARRIGESTIDKVSLYASMNSIPFYEALKLTNDQNSYINWDSNVIYGFINLISELQNKCKNKNPHEMVDIILNKIKYYDYLATFDTAEEVESRKKNIEELKSSMVEFIEKNLDQGLIEYLSEIRLYTDSTKDDSKLSDENVVSLMTIHYAKGTEHPVVFICGMSYNVFPSFRGMSEEERRICFVGITRAKEKLFLSGNNLESDLIDELGKNNIKYEKASFKSISSSDLDWFDSNRDYDPKKMYKQKDVKFMVGDQVVHTTFGAGVVVEVDGDYITIIFKSPFGKKTILSSHIALKRLKN
ncbi:MAG: UvrD-helicase domain-containing protein [Malacoplasma sp.]|nr:UvrD-helicase domain-containing protein [Malacoplasma sp.]